MSASRLILIRYDEIGLKGKNRKYFENLLLGNIKYKLRDVPDVRYQSPHGRIFIYADESAAQECAHLLTFVPGIASLSVGVSMEPNADSIADLGVDWIEPLLLDKESLSFRVKTQRSDKSFPIPSPEFNHQVGSKILQRLSEKGLTVDLTRAEFTLEIEIGDRETVVFKDRVPCMGGLPVGSAGNVLTLISGGIDSPVAAHMAIRRGCRSHFVFFDNRTFLGRGGYDKVLRLTKRLNAYQRGARLFVVPFADIQVQIRDLCSPPHRVVLYRRAMYRIACALAREQSCLALVTGESLGQVASQTLENLAAVSCVVPISVFRPLIGMDKVEIIGRAKNIDTYPISIEPHPDCCSVFMPPRPATRSKIPELEKDEAKYPWAELEKAALEAAEVIVCDEL